MTFSKEFMQREEKLAQQRIDTQIAQLREQGVRQDALDFSVNQLEYMQSDIMDVLYSNPRDAFVFLPVSSEIPDGHTHYSYLQMEDLGAAAIVADGATDRPLVDADLTETTVKIYEAGTGYTYTVGDSARSGGILNFDYVRTKARIAAETIALAHNEYALIGGAGVTNGPAGITGFLNNATVVAAIPSYTDEDWTAITGANAYTTITELIQQTNIISSGVHDTTDVMLTTFVYNKVQALLVNASVSQTVLSALRQNFPEVTFHKSNSGNARGAAGIDRCVAWERNATNAEYMASVIYDESPSIPSGFRNTIHSRGRMAGCVIRRPLSMAYFDVTVA